MLLVEGGPASPAVFGTGTCSISSFSAATLPAYDGKAHVYIVIIIIMHQTLHWGLEHLSGCALSSTDATALGSAPCSAASRLPLCLHNIMQRFGSSQVYWQHSNSLINLHQLQHWVSGSIEWPLDGV